MGGEVGILVLLIYLAMPVVMCMVVPLAVADPATGVLRSVLAERERRVPDPPRFFAVLGPGFQAVPPGPVLPIRLHVVRYEREEVSIFMILMGGRGPEILAAFTPFSRGADRVPLDLSVLAIFPMTSMSMALSILHVGLVLGVELQLHRDILHDLTMAHAGEDDLHPQQFSVPPLHVVEAHQSLPHGVAEYLHVDSVLQPQHSAGFAEVSPEELHYSGMGVL